MLLQIFDQVIVAPIYLTGVKLTPCVPGYKAGITLYKYRYKLWPYAAYLVIQAAQEFNVAIRQPPRQITCNADSGISQPLSITSWGGQGESSS